MGQSGFVRKLALVLIAVAVIGGYVFGYKSVKTVADATAEKAEQAVQIAKIDEAKRLRGQLDTAWQQAVQADPPDGQFDIAVYDNATGAVTHYSNAPTGTTFYTASTIKLSILETLLYQNQKNGVGQLTSAQLAEAEPMIERSDNDSAQALFEEIGGNASLRQYYNEVGARGTTFGDHWGLTQTTAFDQVKILKAVAYPGSPLTAASASQADNLLGKVVSSELWGVNGGVPAGVTVQLKNGWLQGDGDDFSGWVVNSIGHVHGDGTDYVIAVYTSGDKTMRDGINTIEALSGATWKTVAAAGQPQG